MCVCVVVALARLQNRSWTLGEYFHGGQSSGFSHFLAPLFLCSIGNAGNVCVCVCFCLFGLVEVCWAVVTAVGQEVAVMCQVSCRSSSPLMGR